MSKKEEEIRISDVETINRVKALQEHRQKYITKGKKVTKKKIVQECVRFVYNNYYFEDG